MKCWNKWTQAHFLLYFWHCSCRCQREKHSLRYGTFQRCLSFFPAREDMYAQDSIELLTTSGIQFKKHEEEGIETQYFAELLMTSGVVLCEGVKWLSFHR